MAHAPHRGPLASRIIKASPQKIFQVRRSAGVESWLPPKKGRPRIRVSRRRYTG